MSFLLALYLTLAPPLKLTVVPRIGSVPQDVRFTVIIEDDERNRALILVLDGPERHVHAFSEDSPLPHVVEFWFKQVRTPGEYVASVALRRVGEKDIVVTSTLCLTGFETSC